jgi:hypothetical protein
MRFVLDLHGERCAQLLLHRSLLTEYPEGCSEAALQVLSLLEFIVKGGWAEDVSCSLLLEVLLDGEASACGVTVYIVGGLGWAMVAWWYSISIV